MSRLIDRLPQPDKIVEKKIIVLSRSRIGTFSMYQAFLMLGYKPYHMYECVMRGVTHLDLCREAMRNKFLGEGKPYDKADFDKWFANYDVIIEVPQFFVPEFIEMYPNAKFILTERSLPSWEKSITYVFTSIHNAILSFPMNVIRMLDGHINSFIDLNLIFYQVTFHGRGVKGGMQLAKDDLVNDGDLARRLLPEQKLLSVKLEDGFGWEQICPFIGVPIPKDKYPRGNAPAEFDILLGTFIGDRLKAIARKVIGFGVVPAVAVGAWFYTRQK